MPRKKPGKGKTAAARPAVAQALTLAKLLDTADPAAQVANVQHLLKLAVTPVLTLVIQVDSRAPEGTVWVSNVGPAIPGPVAHMMLAAAGKQLAERQARDDAERQQAAAKPPAPTGKKA